MTLCCCLSISTEYILWYTHQGNDDSDTTLTTVRFGGLITHIPIEAKSQEHQQYVQQQQDIQYNNKRNHFNYKNEINLKVQIHERVAELSVTIVQLFLSSHDHRHDHRHRRQYQHNYHIPNVHYHLTGNKDRKNNEDNIAAHKYNANNQQRQTSARVTMAAFRCALLTVWDARIRKQLFHHARYNWRNGQIVHFQTKCITKMAFWRAGTL